MEFIIFILTIVIIVVVAYKPPRQKLVGIYRSALDQTIRKNSNKQKILEYLEKHKAITNTEARDLLKISARTAVRYMDDLEKRGLVKQTEKTGRSTKYVLKK